MRASKPNLVGTLRRLPLFTDLSDEELALIAENVSRLPPRKHVNWGLRLAWKSEEPYGFIASANP
jgi:hypothetical protein